MSDASAPSAQREDTNQARNILIGIVISIVLLTIGLVLIAVALASNAQTASPGVQIVRDLLIIVMALEMIVIGAAITVLLIQVARFINLLNNEIQPLITSTSDTLNTVRGTAVFLSKNLADPVIAASSTLRGVAKVASEVETIRKIAGAAAAAGAAVSPTGGSSSPAPSVNEGQSEHSDNAGDRDGKSDNKSPKDITTKGEDEDGR